MKKIVVINLLLFLVQSSSSQDNDFNRSLRIGVKTMVGTCQPIRFEQIDADAGYNGKFTNSLGLDFSKFFSNKNALQFGIIYSKYRVTFSSINNPSFPPIDPFDEEIEILSIPINFQKIFGHLFYVGLGTLLDFELSRDSPWYLLDTQSGFGLNIEVGKEFQFNRLTLNIAPCVQLHSFAPFKTEQFQQRMFAALIQVGLYYNFK